MPFVLAGFVGIRNCSLAVPRGLEHPGPVGMSPSRFVPKRFPGVLNAGRAFPSIPSPWGSTIPAGTVPTALPGLPQASRAPWCCLSGRLVAIGAAKRPEPFTKRGWVMNGVIISAQSYPAPQQNSLLAAAELRESGAHLSRGERGN